MNVTVFTGQILGHYVENELFEQLIYSDIFDINIGKKIKVF